MKFDLDGQTYTFNENNIPFAEFRYLKRELGLSSGDFFTGVLRLDVEALAGVVLLTMKRRALRPDEKPFGTADLDPINMVSLIESITAHAAEDAAAAAQATAGVAETEATTAEATEEDGEPTEVAAPG